MKLEVAECLEHALEQLRGIWDEIGICEEQRAERQGVVLHHLRSLLSEMVAEERDLRRRLMASVERCGQEGSALAAELGLEAFEVGCRQACPLVAELYPYRRHSVWTTANWSAALTKSYIDQIAY